MLRPITVSTFMKNRLLVLKLGYVGCQHLSAFSILHTECVGMRLSAELQEIYS
jgi:hypothetical protein